MEGLMAKAQQQIETEPTPVQDIAWLQALEEKVHAAAGRIRELKEENAGLRRKVEELEAQLATPTSDEAAGWTEEREEIRGRVARLIEHLEGLL
jgi:predicted RNase H-like nuclease (RuvC/YqgF family)